MERVIKSEISTRNEINDGKTKTVPDQAPGLGAMLQRFRRGLPLDVKQKQPIYNGDTVLPDLKKMDLTEIDEYSRDLKQQSNKLKNEQNQIRKRQIQQEAIRAEKAKNKDNSTGTI